MRRLYLIFGGLGLLIALIFNAKYVPVTLDKIVRDESTGPMRHSRAQSIAYAKSRLFWLGGLPSDAVLLFGGSMTRSDERSGHLVNTQRISDLYIWMPHGEWGTDDRVVVDVHEHADGSLYSGMIYRNWKPEWLRAFDRWKRRAFPPPFAVPSVVQDSCGGRGDVAAAERAIGSPLTYLPTWEKMSYDGSGKALFSTPGVLLHWNAPIEVRAHGREASWGEYSAQVIAAWVSDVRDPIQPEYRYVRLFTKNDVTPRWHWLVFSSEDDEHVCRP